MTIDILGTPCRVRQDRQWLPICYDARVTPAWWVTEFQLFLMNRVEPGMTAESWMVSDAILGERAIVIRQEAVAEDEDYVIRGRGPFGEAGIEIVAASDLGLRLATRHFARLCGFRSLAPTPGWKDWIPDNVEIHCNDGEWAPTRCPAFQVGMGTGCNAFAGAQEEQQQRALAWADENSCQVDGALDVDLGHAWPKYVQARGAPWLRAKGWVSTEGNKLHAEIPEMRQDFVAWAREEWDGTPSHMVSVAASDRAEGWAEIPLHPSDAQALLANACAEAGIPVAIYAYGFMSQPPSMQLHPDVTVVWQTAYMLPDGTPAEAVFDAYLSKAPGSHFILGNYASVWPWSRCLPGACRASTLDGLREYVARMKYPKVIGSCEDAGPNWGGVGYAYWSMAALSMGERPEDRWDEWWETAFGPGLDPPTGPGPSAPILLVLKGYLTTATTFDASRSAGFRSACAALLRDRLEQDDIRYITRAYHMGLYAWHCELWRQFDVHRTPTTLCNLLIFGTQIRDLDLVDWRCVYNDPKVVPVLPVLAAELGVPKMTPFVAKERWGDEPPPDSERLLYWLEAP